ncbi:MAG: hypothetical protein Q8P68_02725 [Candidatus Peregrinibacteria bacterium]|nr:hypothetical protein [Candidatus Peregrinibacteria bacterium]MDZ4244721.1 hypothetical protein [Candidatus Gracilibacteria bacterium]
MVAQILTIQEASKLSQKSTQTIRRLIKTNKIKCKRKRTPQGFNYEINKDSLIKCFGLTIEEVKETNKKTSKDNDIFELGIEPDVVRSKRQKKSILEDMAIPVEAAEAVFEGISIEETLEAESNSSEEVEGEVTNNNSNRASKEALQFTAILQQMMNQHQEDKDRLFALVEQFQKRTLILEERIKRLEAPKRPWWKKIW